MSKRPQLESYSMLLPVDSGVGPFSVVRLCYGERSLSRFSSYMRHK